MIDHHGDKIHDRGDKICPLCGLYSSHAHTEPEVQRLRRKTIEELEAWWLSDV